MSPHLHDSVPVFTSDTAYAEEQRQALHDLLRLWAACPQTQRAMPQEADPAQESVPPAVGQLTQRLQRRLQHHLDLANRRWQAELARARAKAKQEWTALKAERNKASYSMVEDIEERELRLEQKLEQSQWLAESMFEAALDQARLEYKQAREQIERDREALVSLAEDAGGQLQPFSLKAAPLKEADLTEPAEEQELAYDAPLLAEPGDPMAEYEAHLEEAKQALRRMRGLMVPALFKGLMPWTILTVVVVGAAGGSWWVTEPQDWQATTKLVINALSVVLSMGLMFGLGVVGHRLAIRQLHTAYLPVHETLEKAHRDLERRQAHARAARRERSEAAEVQRQAERQSVKQKYQPLLDETRQRKDEVLAKVTQQFNERKAKLEQTHNEKLALLESQHQAAIDRLHARHHRRLELLRQRHGAQDGSGEGDVGPEQADLAQRWKLGLERLEAVVRQSEVIEKERFPAWETTRWARWQPPTEPSALVRFGSLAVDMHQAAGDAAKQGKHKLPRPKNRTVPALLALPERGSLLIETDSAGRADALALMHTVMARLLTTLPPGQVRFTLIDPVGRGESFARFLPLADHDEKLVNSRIWTEAEQIECRLSDLTDHMENVIQKHLRNEFATIDAYNAQAQELAEPYRFVVIADYGHNFSEEAVRRLNSIVTSGARCGVYALVMRDLHHPVPGDQDAASLRQHSLHLVHEAGELKWQDEVFGAFPLSVEEPPGEADLAEILHRVGRKAQDAAGGAA